MTTNNQLDLYLVFTEGDARGGSIYLGPIAESDYQSGSYIACAERLRSELIAGIENGRYIGISYGTTVQEVQTATVRVVGAEALEPALPEQLANQARGYTVPAVAQAYQPNSNRVEPLLALGFSPDEADQILREAYRSMRRGLSAAFAMSSAILDRTPANPALLVKLANRCVVEEVAA